jgi:hypothetical protein
LLEKTYNLKNAEGEGSLVDVEAPKVQVSVGHVGIKYKTSAAPAAEESKLTPPPRAARYLEGETAMMGWPCDGVSVLKRHCRGSRCLFNSMLCARGMQSTL